MQQGMLFHSLEAGARGVDVEQVVGELHEDIHVAQFEHAWRTVVDRHAILRTSFHWPEGAEPVQVVHAPSEVRLGFSYEEFGSEHEARRGLEEYLSSDRRAGFRLDEAPLLRVALIRGGRAHYWWVCTFHHMVLDGRAMAVIFREALDLHDALTAGRTCELPVARPYRGYIDWLQRLDWSRAEKFWRTHLKGFSAPTTLPIDRAFAGGPAAEEGHGELGMQLPEAATNRLRAAARHYDVTVNTLLQAGWALLLSRYAGEEDVVFGAVRACRHIPVEGAGTMVGLFINTVPLRVHVARDLPLIECVHALREQWVSLRDHEHTPLMKIQQWSDVAPGRALFDTLFNYQEPSWDAALRALGGVWRNRQFEIRSQPNYPLAVDAYGANTIIVKLLYDRRRFADDAISRMMGHYRVLLEAIAATPECTVGELPLLTAAEQAELLHEWNDTAAEFDRATCVHTLVEQHATQAPDRPAVADEATSLSYGELNRRANQVAHRLMQLGVRNETPVAVCMERAAEMLVAWLAVLKAGGAFVPLDPAYPKDRLAFQLGDCGAPVLLTQARVRSALPPAPKRLHILDIAADGSGFANEPVDNPNRAVAGTQLAYIIYTSGSTGQPKGVQVEHRSLMNLVTWHRHAYSVTADDRATQLASPAFDASVWEVWPYLASGAAIHFPSEDTRISPAQLLRWMAARRITLAFLPTPLAEAALSETWPQDIALRVLLTGGDKLKHPAPASLPCALVNHYGPTENTVVATCGEVPRGVTGSVPTIGRPIANTRVYVLDGQRQLVPIGVPGELYIGGESLARGYWNRAELTAEKFVEWHRHPADDSAAGSLPASGGAEGDQGRSHSERLYRTGDLVRWRADGELEFLGRIDGQVKIRGCRIELGEIEATLQRHPSVREALVVASTDAAAQTQLVAYVLTQPDAAAAGVNQLAAFLRETLPAYMVPSAFVFLDAWPLTANGKVDRKALPAPAVHGTATSDGAAPRGSLESSVASVWAEVLGHSTVARSDNFFEIGGHSLLAAQVVSRLNAVLGAGLSVRCIFDHPTVIALAQEIAQRLEKNSAPRSTLPRVKRRAPRAEMELVPPS